MKEIVSISEQQRRMHKNFFDHCSDAIEQGYYLEAILMEYAAMEGRLETVLGVLGAPCNNKLPPKERNKFQISHRVACLKKLLKNEEIADNSKLSSSYFKDLEKWLEKRNRYIHGLYKNEIKYSSRMCDKKFAKDGYDLCDMLYAEVNRIKRLKKKRPELFTDLQTCTSHSCTYYKKSIN